MEYSVSKQWRPCSDVCLPMSHKKDARLIWVNEFVKAKRKPKLRYSQFILPTLHLTFLYKCERERTGEFIVQTSCFRLNSS